MAATEIRLFGSPQILNDGENIHFPYRKAEGLLFYLCVKKAPAGRN